MSRTLVDVPVIVVVKREHGPMGLADKVVNVGALPKHLTAARWLQHFPANDGT